MIFKKGLEPIITTVLLVLISLILVAILAVFAFPFIKNSLDDGGCTAALNSISLDDSRYSCIASVSNNVFTGFSIKADNTKITGFLVSLYSKGTAIPIEVSQGKTYSNLRMLDKAFGQSLEVKNDGSTRTYVAVGSYERVDVSPILESGKACQSARSIVSLKQCLDPAIKNQIGSQSFGTNNSGNFTCGNSLIDAGEQCDGVNLNSKTCVDFGLDIGVLGCSNQCLFDISGCHSSNSTCGNSVVELGEECDLGGLNSIHGACTTQCTDAMCGDGFVWNVSGGNEQCDAGSANGNNPDSCRSTCELPTCGDLVCDVGHGETSVTCAQDCPAAPQSCQLTGAYWEVVNAIEGQQVNFHITGTNACNGKSVSVVVKEDDAGGDVLDDDVSVNPSNALFVNGIANTVWTAEWQSDWPVNPPEYYAIATEVTNFSNFVRSLDTAELIVAKGSSTCGDGLLDAGEMCDDHNTNNGDGCSSTCTIESDYTCNNEPSTCSCSSGDSDSDGVCNSIDNCPATSNPGQQDGDGDGLGNACDSCPGDAQNDLDGDGICGNVDNCPSVSNVNQADSDSDGIGDVCDSQYCGNLIIEMSAGEECDGTNLNPLGTQCTSYGHSPAYTSGTVFCKTDCTIDFLGCGYCGDGIVNGAEACDGTNFGSHTNLCTNYTHFPPYTGGTVICKPGCTVGFSTCTGGGIAGGQTGDGGIGSGS